MLSRRVLSPAALGLVAAAAAALALAFAVTSERWGGLVPCALCLWERWPYRIAIILGLVAWLLPPELDIPLGRIPLGRIVLGLVALTMLADAALAAVHVGVEAHWWPSPLPECAAPVFSGGSIAERLAHMPATPAKPCDDPTYLIPAIPISFAAMNLIYSAIFTLAAAWAALRRPR
jgi:disulfide bond formation protein DsbB